MTKVALLSTAANLFNAWLKRSCLLRPRIQKMTLCACYRKRVKRASNILVLLCREFGHWNPRGPAVLHGVPRSHFENRCSTKVFTRVIVLYGALINDKLMGSNEYVLGLKCEKNSKKEKLCSLIVYNAVS